MPIFSTMIFNAIRWSARHGLHEADNQKNSVSPQDKLEKKEKARRTGTRGETYGYWYLRRLGYVFVAKNYMPAGAKGELDRSVTTAKPSRSSKFAPAPSLTTLPRSPLYRS